jgi:hypothetical protein
VAVEQWKSEFKRWCTIDENLITRFSSASGDFPDRDKPGIIICTSVAGTCLLASS